jgi:23S rRNA (cytosine1962-C5)-methyltransferase
VQILERRGAGLDHPVLGGLTETEYLKVLILRVL